MDLESHISGFKSLLYYLLTVWLGASPFNSLDFTLLDIVLLNSWVLVGRGKEKRGRSVYVVNVELLDGQLWRLQNFST